MTDETKLSEVDFQTLVDIEIQCAKLGVCTKTITEDSKLSRYEIAGKMLVSSSVAQRLAVGNVEGITLTNLARFAHATGYKLEIDFVKKT